MVMVGGHGGMAPSASQSSAAAGLPFAGVPSELQEGANRLLAHEPERPPPRIDFDPVADRSPDGAVRRFGLRDMLLPHRPAVIGGLLLLCAETAAMLAGPVLVQQGIDHGIIAGNRSTLNRVVLVYLGIVALSIVLSRVRQRHNGRVAEQMMYDLRLRLFSHYQRLSLDWYTSAKSGVLLSRMTSDMEYVGLLVNEGFVNLIIQALTVAVVTVVLFVYDPLLAVVLLVGIVPPLAALTLWFRARSEAGYGEVRDRIADLLADLSENLAGIRVIAALNRRARNVARHRQVTGRYRDANLAMAKASAIYGPTTEAIGIAAQGLVLAVGGAMVLRDGLAVGELTAFVLFVTTFFAPIQQLVQLYSTYQQGQSGLAKIGQILARHPSVAERPDAVELPQIEGHIRLEGVSFSYDETDPEMDDAQNGESRSIRLTSDPMSPDANLRALSQTAATAAGLDPGHNGAAVEPEERPAVLRNVSLDIRPGETFALVGPTGAGKTSLAYLIPGFYRPTEGRIRLDGRDLAEVDLDALRAEVSYVFQEHLLLNESIRGNLILANPTASEADIRRACDAAGAAEFIGRLPEGLDTRLGQSGDTLSVGQKQRLCIARGLIRDTRVLILDEPTAALDPQTEHVLVRALRQAAEGRLVIVIAHRLSTIRQADRIVFLEDGEIREVGSHAVMMASPDSPYRRFVELQGGV